MLGGCVTNITSYNIKLGFNDQVARLDKQRGSLRRIVMIEVTLVTNDGAGLPCRIPIVEGTILENFLATSFDGNLDEFTIRVRANGVSVEVHRDYVLQDGDRVSLAPTKVDGASA